MSRFFFSFTVACIWFELIRECMFVPAVVSVNGQIQVPVKRDRVKQDRVKQNRCTSVGSCHSVGRVWRPHQDGSTGNSSDHLHFYSFIVSI